jgi:phage gpG-like protein
LADITPKFQERFIEVEAGNAADAMLNMADFTELSIVRPLAISEGLIAGDIARRFRTQTDPEGNPWQEWSESYEAQVEKWIPLGKHTGKKLIKSSYLEGRASMKERLDTVNDIIFYDFSGLPPYGAVQNFGGPVGKGALLPARQFVGMDDATEQAIFKVFSDWAKVNAEHAFGSVGKGGIGGGAVTQGQFGRFVSLRDPSTGLT